MYLKLLRPIGGLPYFTSTNYLDQRNPFAANNRGKYMTEQMLATQNKQALVNARDPIAGHPRTWPKVWPGDAVPAIKENKLDEKNNEAFLKEFNQYRAKYNLKPVKLNKELTEAADQHSLYQTQLNSCNHYGPAGKMHWFTSRAKEAGYTGQPVSENVAAGQNSVKEAIWSWHMSPGHRRAMLDPNITEIGIGFRRGKKGTYGGERWTFVSGKGSQDSNEKEDRRK